VSPCSANPCLNGGSCTVDVNGEAVCACNGEWSGFYCSGLFYIYGQILSNILKLNKVHYLIITKYTIYILTLLQHLVSEMIFDRDFYST
jgi:hypothetical protein